MFFLFCVFLCIDVCAFEGAVFSFSLLKLASLWKDLQMMLTVRVLGGVIIFLGRHRGEVLQLCLLRAASAKTMGSFVVKTVDFLWLALVAHVVMVLRS